VTLDVVREWGKRMVEANLQGGDPNMPPMLLVETPLRHIIAVLNRETLLHGTGLSSLVEHLCIPLVYRQQATAAALICGTWVFQVEDRLHWTAAPGNYDALTLVSIDAHSTTYDARSVRRNLDRGPTVGEWKTMEHLAPAASRIQRAIRSGLN
jgi:hypothetical protein